MISSTPARLGLGLGDSELAYREIKMASISEPPRAHARSLARLMREATGHPRWRAVPEFKTIHDEVGSALAEQHAITPLRGAGLKNWLKTALFPVTEAVGRVRSFVEGARKGYSPPAVAALRKYGNWTVSTLTIRRDPISSVINAALNLVSLGHWNSARTQYGFDKLFHLGLVIGLTSPEGKHAELLAEKLAVVTLHAPKAILPNSEILRIAPPTPPVTLAVFLDKARRAMGDKFFPYDSFSNNCQDFVGSLLRANGALTPAANAFLKQDLEKLVAAQPTHTGAVANVVTDLGARADRLVHGGQVLGKRRRGRGVHFAE